MRIAILLALLAMSGAGLSGQSPSTTQPADAAKPADAAAQPGAAAVGSATFRSDFGFSYGYPSDWEVMDTKPIMPAIQLQAGQKADSDAEKRGVECTQIGLMLRHGIPRSVMMVLVLPFSCYGQELKPSDLPGVAAGVAEGLKKGYDISDAQYGAYRLGTHDFWIERAHAVSKNHPEFVVTSETACAFAKKGLVCWMGFLRDEATIKDFEQGLAALDGDSPAALVPAKAFAPTGK